MPQSKRRKKKVATHQYKSSKGVYHMTPQERLLITNGLEAVCSAAGNRGAMKYFTKKDLGLLSTILYAPPEVKFSDSCKFSSEMQNILSTVINEWFNCEKISYHPDGVPITMKHHLQFGKTLIGFLGDDPPKKLFYYDILQTELSALIENSVTFDKGFDMISHFMEFIACHVSLNSKGHLQWYGSLDHRTTQRVPGRRAANQLHFIQFHLEYVPVTKKTIYTKQGRRTGYSLQYYYPEYGYKKLIIPIDPDHFRDNEETAKEYYDIYISSHAILRLTERVDCIAPPILDDAISLSLANFVCLEKQKMSEHKMFPYYVHDVKVGYFLYETIGKIVYIKTFLFITQVGTPEGKILSHYMGFEKEDRNFWKLGRLSTFLVSDLYRNKEMNLILKECNCSDLRKLKNISNIKQDSRYQLVDDIMNYMHRNQKYYDSLVVEEVLHPESETSTNG